MAVIPISWNLDIFNTSKNRELYDFPVWRDLGLVFGTKYCLKLILKNRHKRNVHNNSHQVISVQFERFLNLSSSNIHGSIFIHEYSKYTRFAQKAFQHSFKDDEKVFSFDMIFRRSDGYEHQFSSINVHGHISVDLAKGTDLNTDQYISSCPVPEIHKSFNQLSSDFGNLLQDNTFSDITLKCGDVELFAHKNILSSRSPVFKAMFQKHTKEALSSEVVITDMEPTALKAMLDYVYCGKTEDFSVDSACNLMYAADKYELLELKEICVSYLKSEITNDNVFRILELAVFHDESLKVSCSNHIGEYFTILEKSKEWISLKKRKPHLVMEILSWIVKFGK